MSEDERKRKFLEEAGLSEAQHEAITAVLMATAGLTAQDTVIVLGLMAAFVIDTRIASRAKKDDTVLAVIDMLTVYRGRDE